MGMWHSIFPAYGFYLRHADGVRFENVAIKPRNVVSRKLFCAVDCTGVDADGLKGVKDGKSN